MAETAARGAQTGVLMWVADEHRLSGENSPATTTCTPPAGSSDIRHPEPVLAASHGTYGPGNPTRLRRPSGGVVALAHPIQRPHLRPHHPPPDSKKPRRCGAPCSLQSRWGGATTPWGKRRR